MKIKINNFVKLGLLVAYLVSGTVLAKSVTLEDKIVAIVDEWAITQSELGAVMNSLANKLANKTNDFTSIKLRQQALDSLIDEALLLRFAGQVGLLVNDKELDEMILNMARANGLTLEEMKAAVLKQHQTFSEFREQTRKQATVSKLQYQLLGKNLQITEQEVKEFIKELENQVKPLISYHLIDVLFEIPSEASSEKLLWIAELAQKLSFRWKKGEEVEEIIDSLEQSFKTDEGKVNIKVNDLGWRKDHEIPSMFVDDVVKMKEQQVTTPIKAPNGFHVLKLDKIEITREVSAPITNSQARELIYDYKLKEKLKPWLKEMKEKSYIKVF
jgi:Parvulin-like peptidyl-prolyl isomerase